MFFVVSTSEKKYRHHNDDCVCYQQLFAANNFVICFIKTMAARTTSEFSENSNEANLGFKLHNFQICCHNFVEPLPSSHVIKCIFVFKKIVPRAKALL